jgi:hypothetical protein
VSRAEIERDGGSRRDLRLDFSLADGLAFRARRRDGTLRVSTTRREHDDTASAIARRDAVRTSVR